jgi:hypothetical protein
MRRLITLAAILFLGIFPISAHAQTEPRLSTASIDIWPEYDQPAVLVIYHLTLSANTSLPTSLTLHVPVQADVTAVAVVDQNGNLVNSPYDRVVQADWAVLSIMATSLQVQVEYYAPLEKNGPERHIVFNWAGDFAVDKLDVNFLQPIGAMEVHLSPPAMETNTTQDALTNYHVQVFNPAKGKVFQFTISYVRTSDELSITSQTVQAAVTPGPNTPGRISMSGFLPGFLLGLGIVLIVGGVIGFLVWQRGRKRTPTGRQGHKKRESETQETVYCQECGKRAQPGDQFCRTCGTRLR